MEPGSMVGTISREPAGVAVRRRRNRKCRDSQMWRIHVGIDTREGMYCSWLRGRLRRERGRWWNEEEGWIPGKARGPLFYRVDSRLPGDVKSARRIRASVCPLGDEDAAWSAQNASAAPTTITSSGQALSQSLVRSQHRSLAPSTRKQQNVVSTAARHKRAPGRT